MPGDQILADRGFNLKDDFAAVCSTELNIPEFTMSKPQLSAKDIETTSKIAYVKIYVERVIGHFKTRYQIQDLVSCIWYPEIEWSNTNNSGKISEG